MPQAQQGIDIQAEIMAALAQEITAEIHPRSTCFLKSTCWFQQTQQAYDQNAVSGTATFVGDEHAALAVMINRVANTIFPKNKKRRR